mgnify:CR=1 FL=1
MTKRGGQRYLTREGHMRVRKTLCVVERGVSERERERVCVCVLEREVRVTLGSTR